jgi:hypothetical protein
MRLEGIKEVLSSGGTQQTTPTLLGAIQNDSTSAFVYFDTPLADTAGTDQVRLIDKTNMLNLVSPSGTATGIPNAFGAISALTLEFAAPFDISDWNMCLLRSDTAGVFLNGTIKSNQWCEIDEP